MDLPNVIEGGFIVVFDTSAYFGVGGIDTGASLGMTNQEIKEKIALLNEGQQLSVPDQARVLNDLLRANKKLIALRRQSPADPKVADPESVSARPARPPN